MTTSKLRVELHRLLRLVDPYRVSVHNLTHEHVYFLRVLDLRKRSDAAHQNEWVAWFHSPAQSPAQIAVYDMRLARLGVILYPNSLEVHVHGLCLNQVKLTQLARVAVRRCVLVVLNLVWLDRPAVSALEIPTNQLWMDRVRSDARSFYSGKLSAVLRVDVLQLRVIVWLRELYVHEVLLLVLLRVENFYLVRELWVALE